MRAAIACDTIRARVLYLPEYLLLEPLRVLRAWWKVRNRAPYKLWLRDLARDPTPNRARRLARRSYSRRSCPRT